MSVDQWSNDAERGKTEVSEDKLAPPGTEPDHQL